MKPLNFGYHVAGTRQTDTFGHRMRKAREYAGISEADAAAGGGITLKSLRRIERAQTQMVATEIRLRVFAKLYRVPEVWLYAGDLAGDRVRPTWYALDPEAA